MNLVSISGHTFDESLLPDRPRVLDVGARRLDFTNGILKLRPRAEVLSLEPDESATLVDRKGVQVLTAALVGDRRPADRYISFSTGEGNYLPDPYDQHLPFGAKSYLVKCLNIRDVTRAEYVEKWDLVKLDCEGSEFGILEDWPLGGIAGQISVEFHDYKNPTRWNDEYFAWLWTQLPDYSVFQHDASVVGEARSHWDTLLIRRD